MSSFNIHGIFVLVTSDTSRFTEFVNDSLSFFVVDDDLPASDTLFSIEVLVNLRQYVSVTRYVAGFEKIGNGAYVSDNTYVCIAGDYLIEFQKCDRNLNVRLRTIKPEGNYKKCRFLLKNFRGRDYYFILRQAVIFPAFWALARYAGIYAMHGSGVSVDGEGIALVGLAGIGKSTVSIALTLDSDASFIADNYLLYDSEKLYPFPEWIRFSHLTKSLLGRSLQKLGTSSFTRYGRAYFRLDKTLISGPVRPRAIILPRLADRTELRKTAVTATLDRIVLSNHHVREFPEHAFPGLVDYLYIFETSMYESRLKSLRSLLERADLYEALIKKNTPVTETFNAILALMDDR